MTVFPNIARAEHFTVFGSRGFIGSSLVRHLRSQGVDVDTPERAAPVCGTDLGHVVYAIGLTADFRVRPYDTMTAHVTRLTDILERGRFESLLYLSSTRVYARAANGEEDVMTPVDVHAPGDLYNISKLAGESLCLNHKQPTVRVARLSNVFGCEIPATSGRSATFLSSVIGDAMRHGHVELGTAPGSCKDFVHVDDVARALTLIAMRGRERLYNVASGRNVTHGDILETVSRVTGCTWSTRRDAPYTGFPRIATDLIAEAFESIAEDWAPANILTVLPDMIRQSHASPTPAQGAVA